MASQFTTILFLTFWLFLSCGNLVHGKKGHPSHSNAKSMKQSRPSDNGLPNNRGHFLLHEGCLELSETSALERNDPRNNNNICSDSCHKEGDIYSATIGDRCLCFDTRPITRRLDKDKCDSTCPKPVQSDYAKRRSSCEGIDCCGSVANNAMTLIQTIKILPHRDAMKKGHHSDAHVTSTSNDFGKFIVHEGCFEKGEAASERKPDTQNVNAVCIDYCIEKDIDYAATINDRCLCLNSLPSNRLADDQCDTSCPGYGYEAGVLCVGFGCCGSEDNDAVSIYQNVPARDKGVKKLHKKKHL